MGMTDSRTINYMIIPTFFNIFYWYIQPTGIYHVFHLRLRMGVVFTPTKPLILHPQNFLEKFPKFYKGPQSFIKVPKVFILLC